MPLRPSHVRQHRVLGLRRRRARRRSRSPGWCALPLPHTSSVPVNVVLLAAFWQLQVRRRRVAHACRCCPNRWSRWAAGLGRSRRPCPSRGRSARAPRGTLPSLASTQTFCHDTSPASVPRTSTSYARRVPVSRCQITRSGARGAADLVDLPSATAAARAAGTWAWWGDVDRRLLGDRRPDDPAVGVGEDDEVAADHAQALVGPLVGHRVDAVVALRTCRRGRTSRRRRAPARSMALDPGAGRLLGLEAGIARRGCGAGRGDGRNQEGRSDG